MEKNKNVLLVDDRRDNILVLESVLEDLPLNLFNAESGNEALKVLLNKKIDLIFMDVRMPGMSGLETAGLIRGIKKTKDIPIVLISGEIEKDYEKFKKQYPKNIDYMIKPIDISVIHHHVANYLSVKK